MHKAAIIRSVSGLTAHRRDRCNWTGVGHLSCTTWKKDSAVRDNFSQVRYTSTRTVFQPPDITFHQSAKAIVRLPDRGVRIIGGCTVASSAARDSRARRVHILFRCAGFSSVGSRAGFPAAENHLRAHPADHSVDERCQTVRSFQHWTE